ncbi:hypothetical protein BJK06_08325 [Curtobacterium sp. BH-2-1-1]|uniref:hypothetical protein n=1 Tax=Curtobacterium sp. BH-2-1-1 TaxID=1905847 RepID=UPI00089DE0A0|nr:hypothetical protein [Curtobacterium sp. BH-2-1-1]AOX65757.1 hypothetical protein BJK06_08325 [Curtobacterium sp. BH-2-1-1]
MATGVKYDSLWKEAHRSFNRGTLRVGHAPVDGDARWGLSLVLLPPAHIADAVSAAAAGIGSLYAGTHHIYNAADLHLTVTSLEPYRDKVAQTTIEHYVDAVERARDLLEVNVRLVGLGGSPSGVFVQGSDDETLLPIRRQMRQAAADLHDGVAPPMAFVRDTAHISISVHREAVPEPWAAEYVQRHRRTGFGDIMEATVALARYRATEHSMSVEVLHTVR